MQGISMEISREISTEIIRSYQKYLMEEEKSQATIEKYIRDVRVFAYCVGKRELTKELVLEYKRGLIEKGYAVRSIDWRNIFPTIGEDLFRRLANLAPSGCTGQEKETVIVCIISV